MIITFFGLGKVEGFEGCCARESRKKTEENSKNADIAKINDLVFMLTGFQKRQKYQKHPC